MPTYTETVLEPRKSPRQARSAATVEAILEATLQLLIEIGKERLTTTRIAQRAGVSVGTLYQYFPNKKALLRAILRQKLTAVTEAVEHACERHKGEPLCELITAVANDFFRSKMKNPKASLALYSISSDVDGIRVMEGLRIRGEQALTAALESAPEALAIDYGLAALMVQSAMTGVSRRMLESKIAAHQHDSLRAELVSMLCAYLTACSVPAGK